MDVAIVDYLQGHKTSASSSVALGLRSHISYKQRQHRSMKRQNGAILHKGYKTALKSQGPALCKHTVILALIQSSMKSMYILFPYIGHKLPINLLTCHNYFLNAIGLLSGFYGYLLVLLGLANQWTIGS